MNNDNGNHHPIARERQGHSLQLHGSGSNKVGALIDNAMTNLTHEQAHNLAAKAADEALRLHVKFWNRISTTLLVKKL